METRRIKQKKPNDEQSDKEKAEAAAATAATGWKIELDPPPRLHRNKRRQGGIDNWRHYEKDGEARRAVSRTTTGFQQGEVIGHRKKSRGGHVVNKDEDSLLLQVVLARTTRLETWERTFVFSLACMSASVSGQMTTGGEATSTGRTVVKFLFLRWTILCVSRGRIGVVQGTERRRGRRRRREERLRGGGGIWIARGG